VLLCAIRNARRMRLRFDGRDRLFKLTHPRHVRPAAALAWAATQRAWIDEQLASEPPPEPFVPGARVPVEGRSVQLCWEPGLPRVPRLEGDRLTCGGPLAGLARRIELFLRRRALDILSAETADIAARAGVRARSVAIGDARTRWGSCTSSGSIRYSWRLVLAPPEVRRFVVAHEVAHLRHLDHGRSFKALERELFGGDTEPAERLLKDWGPRLRRIGIAA
jgi:predicted metal-dependent hydrolase